MFTAKLTLSKKWTGVFAAVLMAMLAACNSSSSAKNPSVYVTGSCNLSGVSQQSCPAAASNVIPLQVGSTLSSSYFNEPVVSVKICVPGTSQCQTIDNILLDTGSYGLRLFQSVVSVALPKVTTGGKDLAECVIFGTGSTWGPVKSADVYLGGESAVTVPVQMIDQTYYTTNIPSSSPDCASDPDLSPTPTSQTAGSGYNGILGVGMVASDGDYGYYYACSGSGGGASCTSTNPVTSLQVTNPVSALLADGNGLSIILPPVAVDGAGAVTGCMVLGIGTQSNNAPGAVTVLQADSSSQFRTVWNGQTYSSSFIDSGSNGFYFPQTTTALPSCITDSYGDDLSGFYCPTTTQCLSAVQKSAFGHGTTTSTVEFAVANGEALFESANYNYSSIGGILPSSDDSFDWGLPFFFGRTVYVGISGQDATINGATKTGPFWAY